jgi:hypothetical protein
MLKRDITYKDFNDEDQTETFYFNISKTEIVDLDALHPNGMQGFIENIVKTNDKHALVNEFKKIILLSYGKKSEDGKRFIKTDELREEFSQTAAFDSLFIELATDDEKASEFIIGVMPKDLREEMQKEIDSSTQTPPPPPPPAPPTPQPQITDTAGL